MGVMNLKSFIAVDWGTTNRRSWVIDGGVATAPIADVARPEGHTRQCSDTDALECVDRGHWMQSALL